MPNVNVVKVIRTVYRINDTSSPAAKPVVSVWATKPTLKLDVNAEVPSKPEEVPSTPTINIPPISPTPTIPRPDFLEPLSPTSSVQLHTKLQIAEYWNWQMDHPGFWEEKIEQLEKRREKYNVKGGWSAKDVVAADAIDEELRYCFKELQQLKEDMDYSEDYADINETIQH
jgi:hypothetical protein